VIYPFWQERIISSIATTKDKSDNKREINIKNCSINVGKSTKKRNAEKFANKRRISLANASLQMSKKIKYF